MDRSLVIIFILHVVMQNGNTEAIQASPYITGACPDAQQIQELHADVAAKLTAKSSCKDDGGWRKIMDIDMSDPSDNCPQGLTTYTSPFRLCGRTRSSTYDFCESSTVPVGSRSYTRVCGRIKGYQQNIEYSFWGRTNIDSSYLDGVSLTYGLPGSRQHIWSFVTALSTQGTGRSYCPLPGATLPSFITDDYFCDSGQFSTATAGANGVYVNHPLWDGVVGGCNGDPITPPRCYANNPPWFHKTLPSATTEDIELRVCGYSNTRYGDTLLQEIELYVK